MEELPDKWQQVIANNGGSITESNGILPYFLKNKVDKKNENYDSTFVLYLTFLTSLVFHP